MVKKDKLSLYAVGDLGVTRDSPGSAFSYNATAAVLNEPDIMFGQLEVTLSQKGSPSLTSIGAQKACPGIASVMKSVGFDILSFAGNHCLDWGPDNLLDTIDIAKQTGIILIGVGKDISEARKPVIIEQKGVRIAFLAYNSILPPGYWATAERPGCAPIRVRTLYEPFEPVQPGSPAEAYTYAYKEDVEAMVEDIKKVRPMADIVVMSIHWGLHLMPAKLLMDQLEVGHAAIDAGVDLILGHHAHILKGIEVYKGKVILYSLGNFAMDSAVAKTWPNVPARRRLAEKLYNFKIEPEWGPVYPFPPDSRKTIIAKCIISNKRIEKVSFLPVVINKLNQPQVASRNEENFSEVVKYMQWICEDQKLATKFSLEGDEVVINM